MIPVGQAVGKVVKCPDCGAPSRVSLPPHRVIESPEPGMPPQVYPRTAANWCIIECPKVGKKQVPHSFPVEIVEASHVRG